MERDHRVLCDLDQLVTDVVDPPAEARLIGFKTIRVFEKATVLARALPCALFVVNVRRDLDRQLRSGWWRERLETEAVGDAVNWPHRYGGCEPRFPVRA